MARVIFGSSGCIGKYLCKLTGAKNIDYVALNSSNLDLLASDAPSKIKTIVNENDDIVILSALTPENGNAVDATAFNIIMMQNLLAGLRKVQFGHLVYISSDSVFSHSIENITEQTIKTPDRLYGYAHLIREQMLKHELEDKKWVILRPCAVYGHFDTHKAYGVMRFLHEAVDNRCITLFGNGEEFRDHVHGYDLAQIINEALAKRVKGEMNVSSGHSITFSNLASMIVERMNVPVKIKSINRKIKIAHRFIDNKELISHFPNQRPRQIEAGLDSLFKSIIV